MATEPETKGRNALSQFHLDSPTWHRYHRGTEHLIDDSIVRRDCDRVSPKEVGMIELSAFAAALAASCLVAMILVRLAP